MKASIKREETFIPVTISVTFTSKEEMQSFWHRMNISTFAITETKSVGLNNDVDDKVSRELWKLVDQELKNLK